MQTKAAAWSPAVSGAVAAQLAHVKTSSLTGEVHSLDPLTDPRWAALVEAHPQASVFHSPKWLRALRAVYGYEPGVVTTAAPGETLTNGLVYCRVQSWVTGKRLVSLPFSDHCQPLANGADELEVLVRQMKNRVKRERWKYFELRPVSGEPGGQTGLIPLVRYYFHALDLRPTSEQLFQKFHKDCIQRKIRRAEREKLHYEEGTTEESLQTFYRLLVMTRRRQFLPPQPLAWFRGLIAAFGGDLKIRVASKDGVAVAGILTLAHKRSIFYKYGCSDATFNNLGGTALLFWKTILDAKARGLEELEFGRTDCDNEGLAVFKDRWGAARKSITYWSYPACGAPGPGARTKAAARLLLPAVPDFALKAAGTLWYRHIG
jgi:lipid II:glycine glycyltransferase (peptidoglycan interpeptide bridge formation enzyme)